jgi:hypothetical protein
LQDEASDDSRTPALIEATNKELEYFKAESQEGVVRLTVEASATVRSMVYVGNHRTLSRNKSRSIMTWKD